MRTSLSPARFRDVPVAPLSVGLIAGLVYVLTLMPGVAFGDWGEMQVVPHVLGIAHPTGYPTYLLLAHTLDLLPIGTVAARGNLLSAVLVAGAAATTTAIVGRLGVRPVLAVATGLAFGFVSHVWQSGTVAEVNSLHLLFAALLVHRCLIWAETHRAQDLALGGLLLGLSLGNHLLTLFLAPFLGLYVLWTGRHALRARPHMLPVAAAAGLAGLSVYLYIPLAAAASPPLAYNDPTTLSRFVELVTGQQFRGQFDFLSSSGPSAFASSLPELWRVLTGAGTPLLPLVATAGLVILLRTRTAFGLTLLGILLAVLYFWGSYVRLDHYLLVPWLVLAISAGFALEWTVRHGRTVNRPIGLAAANIALAGSIVFAAGLGVANWKAADRSHDQSGQQFVDELFQELPPNAAILTYWDTSTPLWYAQLVENLRPDVLVVDDTDIVYGGWQSRELRLAAVVCTRPSYILRLEESELEPTRGAYRLTPVAALPVARGGPAMDEYRPLYRVDPKSGTCP